MSTTMPIANEAPTTRHRQGVAPPSGPPVVVPLFVMPSVRVGQSVMWYPDWRSKDGVPAMVTSVGENSIAVSLFIAGALQVLPKDSVHHRADPDKAALDNLCRADNPCGVWDYVEDGRDSKAMEADRFLTVMDRCAALEKRVADLEELLTKPK